MNERIKELEARCWEPKQYGPPWFNSQKFAELIVADCIELAGNHYDARSAVNDIKQHFGVEE
jgi:hypothetical protein